MAHAARHLLTFWKFRGLGGEKVRHMHRYLIDDRAAGGIVPVDGPSVQTYRYRTVMLTVTQVFPDPQEHGGIIGIAELAGILDNGLEHRPDIGWRRCDHAEDVAAAGLVGQRFGK